MEIVYPEYLIDTDMDDFALKTLKAAGREMVDTMYLLDFDLSLLSTIRIAVELGDDMQAPIVMSPLIQNQIPECRYLADIRFLIENYDQNSRLPLWRERYLAFNKHQENIASSPLITKAHKFQTGRGKGSISLKVAYIHNLANNNKSLVAKEIMKLADKKVIGEMSYGTFRNHVSNTKNRQVK